MSPLRVRDVVARDVASRNLGPRAENVADAEQARVDQADHVARVRLVDRHAVGAEEAIRMREPHLAQEPHVRSTHPGLEGSTRVDLEPDTLLARLAVVIVRERRRMVGARGVRGGSAGELEISDHGGRIRVTLE